MHLWLAFALNRLTTFDIQFSSYVNAEEIT